VNQSVQVKPLFSLDKLSQLTNGDKIAMTHFNSIFMSETVGKDLPKLLTAVEEGDYANIKKFAHKMKSSIDLYAIDMITRVVKDVEKLATQQSDIKHIEGMVAVVEDTLIKVRDKMNNLD
jgi:hypothetical protein